jgi:hypothetical protein
MEKFDRGSLKGSVEGYIKQSKEIFDEDFLNSSEEKIIKALNMKGFSFPTNEGMRKITKKPETHKIENDPTLDRLVKNLRTTTNGVRSNKTGGVYAGVNAFHHGHLAYLSKSEAVVAVDMNELVPHGFAFVVGMVGAIKTPEDFRHQVGLMAANPERFKDFFAGTDLEKSVLVNSEEEKMINARRRLLDGLVSTMSEFNPALHGSTVTPPVFCYDKDAYNYFRTLILQDKVAGVKVKLDGAGMINILAKALDSFNVDTRELNTLYVSSCFDPRFAGPQERLKFFNKLSKEGYKDMQIIESFLNSGWIVYDIENKS